MRGKDRKANTFMATVRCCVTATLVAHSGRYVSPVKQEPKVRF